MIVMKKSDDPAFGGRQYSHIECDVEGCGEMSPPASELHKKDGSLMERGWYIEGGRHRCPRHFHDEVPARDVEVREADAENVR